MKLHAKIDGEDHDIEIVEADGRVTARVRDREYVLDVTQPEPNIFALRNGCKLVEVFVSPDTPAGAMKAAAGGHEFKIEITDPKRLRGSAVDAEHAGGAAEIKTAMPGKVVRVLVEAGAKVKKGDGILVVEAMKMQNEMKAPKDGTVREIRVAEGETVNAGDVLARIE